MIHNKKVVALALTLGVAVGVVVLSNYRQTSSQGTNESRSASYEHRWSTGESWTYALNFRSESNFNLPLGPQSGNTPPKTSLTLLPMTVDLQDANFTISVVKQDDLGFQLFMQCTTPNLNVEGPGQNKVMNPQPWVDGALVDVNRSGGIRAIHFAPTKSAISSGFFKVMFAVMFPHLASEMQQSIVPGGSLEAQQILSGGDDSNTFQLESKFTKFKPDSTTLRGVVSGSSIVVYTPEFLSRLDLTRNIQQYDGARSASSEYLKITLRLLHKVKSSSAIIAKVDLLQQQPQAALNDKEEFAEVAAEIAKKLIAGTSFSELSSRFLTEIPRNFADDHHLYDLLKAWLFLHPELIPTVAEWLDQLPPNDPRYDLVGVLLVNSGHFEGQTELLTRIRDQFDNPKAVEKLMFSLALTDSPTQETVDEALSWIRERPVASEGYSTALPLAGGIGYHADSASRAKIAEAIVNGPLASPDRYLRTQAANALGNLGYEGTVDKVRHLLRSSLVEERQLGVTCLRRVQGRGKSEADDVLVNIAALDGEPTVRREAALNLDGHNLNRDQIDIVASRLSLEKDPATLIAFVQDLASTGHDAEYVRRILSKYNASCGHPAVCKKVESVLLLLTQRP